jgi:regulator of sigma E protease
MIYLTTGLQIFLGLMGLSFLVFIHELGHFLVAKYFGVRVKVFSIGFGKKLIKFTRNDTEYCLSAIPFGGYVAMAGENPLDADEDQPGNFSTQPVYVRGAIALGGPLVNIVFAYLFLIVIYYAGFPESRNEILKVGFVAEESAGAQGGVRSGDIITSVDGKKILGWNKFSEKAALNLGSPLVLDIRRGEQALQATITPKELKDFGIGYSGIHPMHFVVIDGEPTPDMPAASAGFMAYDTLVEVEGIAISSRMELISLVMASEGRELNFQVRRNDGLHSLSVTPIKGEEDRWVVGIPLLAVDPEPPVVIDYTFPQALNKSWDKSIEFAQAPFVYLASIFQGKIKLKAMSGPVGIVQIIGRTWEEGVAKLFFLLALISMNLGIMNLLPLAITDGGILMFLGIELMRGKPLSRKVQIAIQQTATVGFIMLFLYITTQDLFRFSMFMN